jgi:hypothetical protein
MANRAASERWVTTKGNPRFGVDRSECAQCLACLKHALAIGGIGQAAVLDVLLGGDRSRTVGHLSPSVNPKTAHGDCNKAIDATLAEFAPYRRLTELTMVADSVREPVDNSAPRSIPVRRLAYTAAQWIDRLAGLLAYVEDTSEVWVRPENADPKIYSAAQIANQALSLGLPVRPTIAAELNVRTRTVDRLLAKAKAEGWFDDQRKFTA